MRAVAVHKAGIKRKHDHISSHITCPSPPANENGPERKPLPIVRLSLPSAVPKCFALNTSPPKRHSSLSLKAQHQLQVRLISAKHALDMSKRQLRNEIDVLEKDKADTRLRVAQRLQVLEAEKHRAERESLKGAAGELKDQLRQVGKTRKEE